MTAAEAIQQLAKAVRALETRVGQLEEQLSDQVTLTEEVGDLGLGVPADAPRAAEDPAESGERTRRRAEPQVARARTVRGDTVEYLPPTKAQEKLRTRLLPRIGLENLPPEHGVDPATARRAFLRGGPLYLYDFDRDFVMGLAPQVRKAFVEDVLAVDPEAGYDLGRDILKDEDPGDPEFALEKDKQWRRSHGGATGATMGAVDG